MTIQPINFDAFDTLCREHNTLRVERPECRATVSLLGGQLLQFQAEGQHPLLWHNPNLSQADQGTLRQGAPICWPWFGALSRNPLKVTNQFPIPEAPSHGLVRQASWQLLKAEETSSATTITLAVSLPEWQLAAEIHYRFGRQVTLELVSHNLGSHDAFLSLALHSYFAISGIDQIEIPSLDQCDYIDALENFSQKAQSGSIRFQQEVDRIYLDTPPTIELHDHGWQRTLRLECHDSHSAIVWNPWIEKSRRLSQFQPDSFKDMVCIETARAWSDHLWLRPHDSHRLKLTLSAHYS